MIRYALACADGHEFEAWFRNSEDFDVQKDRGLVECPQCGSVEVSKQLMAPAVRTSRQKEATANSAPDFATLARQVQAHIRSNFDYVGEDFAREARAIHRGDAPERLIYGETTAEEREQLSEEGVPCAPLPAPFAPTPPKKAH